MRRLNIVMCASSRLLGEDHGLLYFLPGAGSAPPPPAVFTGAGLNRKVGRLESRPSKLGPLLPQ